MRDRTYCSSCGALLPAGAVVCGECGAQIRTSVWDGRRGPAPGAWSGAWSGGGAEERPAAAPVPDDEPAIERLGPGHSYPGHGHPGSGEPGSGQPGTGPAGLPDGRTGVRPVPAAPAPPVAEEEETPQRELEPPLDGVLVAPYGRRVLATAIDAVLWGLVTVPLTIGLVLTLLASAAGDRAGVLALVLLFVGAVVVVVYLGIVVFFHSTRAVTPGKKITGLRLVSRTIGKPLGMLRVTGRYLLFALGSAVPLLGLVMPLSPLLDGSGRRQGIHDRLLDAVLVDIARGRNPLRPRLDSFDRAPDSEYLPAGPQQIDADTRMRATPGAPWAAPAPDAAPAATAPRDAASPPPPGAPASVPTAPAWAPAPPARAPEAGGTEDTETTRVFRRPCATVRARLLLDDGRVLPLAGRTLVGRNPAADDGEEVAHLLSVSDPGRSLSKTHLQIDVGDDGVTATDRYSTNGTLLRSDAGRQPLAPGTAISVPHGGALVVGDRELEVEWERG